MYLDSLLLESNEEKFSLRRVESGDLPEARRVL